MSKRHYLADIYTVDTGDGLENKTAIADYPVKYEGGFPVNMETGAPLRNWTLVVVDTDDHAPLLGDSRINALPNYPLDGKVSGINASAKNALLAAMERRGIDTTNVPGMDTYQEVISWIGAVANSSPYMFAD
jgi:hypothetical protein